MCLLFVQSSARTMRVYVYLIDLTKDMDIYKKIWQKFVFMLFTHALHSYIQTHKIKACVAHTTRKNRYT